MFLSVICVAALLRSINQIISVVFKSKRSFFKMLMFLQIVDWTYLGTHHQPSRGAHMEGKKTFLLPPRSLMVHPLAIMCGSTIKIVNTVCICLTLINGPYE